MSTGTELWSTSNGRLIHYARQPLESVKSAGQYAGPKPSGLWVSVAGEDDWPSWCRSENFRPENLSYATEVIPAETARILHLRSASWIDHFHHSYIAAGPIIPILRGHNIDWPAVARKYDGIVIAPYIWGRRLDGDARWYYSWDCASGCIWNADAVASLRVLEPMDATDA